MKSLILSFILLLGLTLTGCSKKSDVNYMSIADKNVKENNISKAVEAFQTLIKDYPTSPKAPEAMFKLGTLYQNKMVKNLSEDESLKKAVDLFSQVYVKYPDSKIAPKAMFMSGFILANDIHDFHRATETFRSFLQKYPDNELATSAREELSNMGMTPAEILAKQKDSKI